MSNITNSGRTKRHAKKSKSKPIANSNEGGVTLEDIALILGSPEDFQTRPKYNESETSHREIEETHAKILRACYPYQNLLQGTLVSGKNDIILMNLLKNSNPIYSIAKPLNGTFFKMLIISAGFYIAHYLAFRSTYKTKKFPKPDPDNPRNALREGPEKKIVYKKDKNGKVLVIQINTFVNVKELLSSSNPSTKNPLYKVLSNIYAQELNADPDFIKNKKWMQSLSSNRSPDFKLDDEFKTELMWFQDILHNILIYIDAQEVREYDINNTNHIKAYQTNKMRKIKFRSNIFPLSSVQVEKNTSGEPDTKILVGKLEFINGKMSKDFIAADALNIWNTCTYQDTAFCETFGCSFIESSVFENKYDLINPRKYSPSKATDRAVIATIISKSGAPLSLGNNGFNENFADYINGFTRLNTPALSIEMMHDQLFNTLRKAYPNLSDGDIDIYAITATFKVTQWITANLINEEGISTETYTGYFGDVKKIWDNAILWAADLLES